MCDVRAEKSGIALEAQQKIHGKYDTELASQILHWVHSVTGEDFNTDGNLDNFCALFKDGTLLCRLANSLQPGVVKKINSSGMAFQTDGEHSLFPGICGETRCKSLSCSRLANSLQPGVVKKINSSGMAFSNRWRNIAFFLAFAEKHVAKSELFQTVDLYEAQDPNAVLICLSSLARKSEKLFGKPGLGPKEAEGEKRSWTEEQLKAGQNVIGLQMGSNKGATASGINFGNTRHM
ncbi:hypothetical protein OSTOST_08669 [Ostertagia ostertagi]